MARCLPGERIHHAFEQGQARYALPARIGVGEHAPEVAQGQRAQEGLAHGMGQDIGIRVALEPSLRRDGDAAQYEGAAVDERVEIEAEAAPRGGHRRLPRSMRTVLRSSGVVILMFRARPSTMATRPPSRSTSIASSVPRKPSRAALSWASRKSSRRKACGV